MEFRPAERGDLPQLAALYRKIAEHMKKTGLFFWDDVYPAAFLGEDIEARRLYAAVQNGQIVSAFALCASHPGAGGVQWSGGRGRAVYLERLGVSVCHRRCGIGGAMLDRAAALARESGAAHLRLFAVKTNAPAIALYTKSGFTKAGGFYEEAVPGGPPLCECGFEKKLVP